MRMFSRLFSLSVPTCSKNAAFRANLLATLVLCAVMVCPFVAVASVHADEAGQKARGVQGGPITILKDGKNPAPFGIVNLPHNGVPIQTLQRFLLPEMKRITGLKFSFAYPKLKEHELPRPSIVLKLEVLKDDQGNDLPLESFKLSTHDGRFYITSGSLDGIRYGFYDWLERLGAKFWSWNESDLPKLKNIVVEPINFTWVPPFTIHNIMSREAQTHAYDFSNKSRSESTLQFTGNHTLYPLLTPYAKTHPEIYPFVKSKNKKTGKVTEGRKANKIHFCYSDPHIAQALADALSKEVEKRHGNVRDYIYMAGMGDWYGGQCMGERCQAIYKEERWIKDGKVMSNGYSGTLLRMINKTAKILDKKYPGIKVGTFAYMSLEMPPGKTVPGKNVYIEMPRLRHCGVHPVDNDVKNAQYWAGLERWTELAPNRVYVWEYGASFDNFLNPYPALQSMAKNIKAYHRIGVAGLDIQGNYVSMGGHMVVINNWVWSQLMDDPSRDIDTLIKTFTDGYYGPAASQARAYIDTLKASVMTPKLIHANEFTKPRRSYLTKAVLAKLKTNIQDARDALSSSDNKKYLRRVNELGIGVEMADLWSQGPLIPNAKGDRLVRKDIGDTYDRAKALTESARGASPREWGQGRAYWLTFMSWHGGPMANLTQGDLNVRVVPSQGGGFGPVTLAGKGLFKRSFVTSVRSGEFVKPATADSAISTGDSGIGMWSPKTKRVIQQSVTVPDDKTIHYTVNVNRVDKAKGYARSTIHIQTTIDGRWSKIFYRDGQNQWHPFTKKVLWGKSVNLGVVTAWRIESSAGTFVDQYKALTAKADDKGNMPQSTATITLARNRHDLYLIVHVPTRDVPMNKLTPCVDRTITITPPK